MTHSNTIDERNSQNSSYPQKDVNTIDGRLDEIIGKDDIVEFGDPLLSPTHASLKARNRDELRKSQRERLGL